MLDYSKIKVLLTDGSSRQGLTILRGLKAIGCHVTVLCSSRLDTCYTSRFADEKIVDKAAAGSNEGFEAFIKGVIESGKYDVVLPVAEITTDKITKHEKEFLPFIKIACAPREAYIQAFNKQRTFNKAMEIGIPCPYTRTDGQSLEAFICEAHFPVIIKPRQGIGSVGFHKFETEQELREAVESGKVDIDTYVLQEFIPFETRISANMLIDQDGNAATAYACEVLRWYPIDAGTAVLIQTVDAPVIINSAAALLKALGWRGFANVGFMIDKRTGSPKLMEINGRIPASVKMSWLCGFNVAKQLIDMACGEKAEIYPVNTKFGMKTRHMHADIPWFIKSPDRFRCKPSWFSWKDTYDVIFWRDDPLPWFSHTLQELFRAPGKLKKKSHTL